MFFLRFPVTPHRVSRVIFVGAQRPSERRGWAPESSPGFLTEKWGILRHHQLGVQATKWGSINHLLTIY